MASEPVVREKRKHMGKTLYFIGRRYIHHRAPPHGYYIHSSEQRRWWI